MDLIYRFDPFSPIQLDSAPDAAAAMRVLCEGNQRLTSVVARMQRAAAGDETEGQIVVPICRQGFAQQRSANKSGGEVAEFFHILCQKICSFRN